MATTQSIGLAHQSLSRVESLFGNAETLQAAMEFLNLLKVELGDQTSIENIVGFLKTMAIYSSLQSLTLDFSEKEIKRKGGLNLLYEFQKIYRQDGDEIWKVVVDPNCPSISVHASDHLLTLKKMRRCE